MVKRIRMTPGRAARNRAMLILRQQGWTFIAIAKKYWVTRSQVQRIIKQEQGRSKRKQLLIKAANSRLDNTTSIYTFTDELGAKTSNCLKNDSILTIGDLVKYSEAELLRVPGFGRKCLDKVKRILKRYKRKLGDQGYD